MNPVGGLRTRLLYDSFVAQVAAGLSGLGWLDATIWDTPPGTRRHHRVRVSSVPLHWNEPVEPNVVAAGFTDIEPSDIEVGSNGITDDIGAYIDLFAESDSLALELCNDLRDILRGRLGSTRPSFPIWDYRHATPPLIGHAQINEVQVLRSAQMDADIWKRHWHRVTCRIQDSYLA